MTKRAVPILILAILALSILTVLPAAYALPIPTLDEYSGAYGDTIVVEGEEVTAGVSVKLYWDAVKSWDGEKGLVNTTEADADGSYEVWFDVPEAVAGDHYLWVKDTDTGETARSALFTVLTLVEVSSSSGLPGKKITVDGYGFGEDKDIAILLASTATPDGAGDITAEPITTGTAETEYEFTLDNAPVEPGSVTIDVAGVPKFTDDGDGTLSGEEGGTINYVTGEVEIEFTAAPVGQAITADYEWYDDVAHTVYVFTTAADSNDLGSFSKSVTVPDDDEMTYGDYFVYAFDAVGNDDDEDFTIGAVITLDVEEGPVGTVVEIRGEGFNAAVDIDAGDIVITIDGADPIECFIEDEPVDIDAPDGDFKLDIVIPQVTDIDDYDTIEVTDVGGGNTATADFTVTGLAEIEVDPEFGVQGVSITISGYNFTAISGEEVVVELWDEDVTAKVTDIDTFETDADGEFSETTTIPAKPSGTYAIVALQTDYGIDADKSFRIGMMIVILSPDDGPTGTRVIITATGFTDDGDWNATLDDVVIFEDQTAETDGTISAEFYVPTVDVGTHTLTVLDIDAEIDVTVEFEVTYTTTVTLDPVVAPNEYNVTIEGWYFAAIEGDLDFVLYNATDDWDMDVKQFKADSADERDALTNEDGNFTAWWEVLDDEDLSVGDYTINITDSEDLFIQVPFSLVSKEVEITPRKTTFVIGDTVSFNIESSFTQHDSYIDIDDPAGNLYWKTDPFTDGSDTTDDLWLKVGVLQVVPYYSQTAGGNPMILLDDAPLGTWSWTWYDDDDDELDSGIFTVAEAPAVVLEERMSELETSISGLSDDVSGLSDDVSGLSDDVSGLQTDIAGAKSAADAANAAAKSAADAVSDVADTAASAKTAADAAKSSADAAKTAADEAKSAAGGLTNLVWGAIGASILAALVGIFSLMQISRRIAG